MKKRNSRKPLRGALIGFGNMAEKGHLPGWLREKRVSLRAVCDTDPRRRRRAGELIRGVPVYRCPEALLETEALDFVDICTPPPSHAALMGEALGRGLHVLCEKPFVASRRELERIRRLSDKTNRIAFPVHNWKHAPILSNAIDWVRKGHIGRVLHSEFHTLRSRPAVGLTPWRDEREEAGGGGIFLDHGWHGIYLLLNLHGEPPRSVSAWMQPIPSEKEKAEHTASVRLGFREATASLFLTWKADRRYNSARVYGERGFLVLEEDRLVLRAGKGLTRVVRYRAPLSQGSHHPEWFGPVLDRFIRALGDRRLAAKEFEEASLCLETTRRGYQSAQRGGTRMLVTPQRRGAKKR